MAKWDIGAVQFAGNEVSVVRWDGANLTEVDDIFVGSPCQACDWHPEGHLLAVGTTGNPILHVYSWDGTNLALLASVIIPGGNRAYGVTWSRDERYIGVSGTDAPFFTLVEWDGANLSVVASYILGDVASDCSFYPQPDLPEGKFIAVANRSGTPNTLFKILKWDGSNLSLATSIDLSSSGYLSCHFSRDGEYIAVSSETQPCIRILKFDRFTLSLSVVATYDVVYPGTPWPYRIRWGPNGDVVASVRENAPSVTVLKFDGSNLTLGDTYDIPGIVWDCSWDHTGEFLVIGQEPATHLTIFKWNGANLTLADTMPGGVLNAVRGCSFYVPPLILPELGAPHNLLCEQKKNPTDVTDPNPEFSARHRYE